MRFEIGRHYTREQIHDALGGGLTEFLPHRDGKVVAGCFNPALNPRAPDVVAVGPSPNAQRWAEAFTAQGEPVPVFLKDDVQRWRYAGEYRVERQVLDPDEISAHTREGVEPPACLLYLVPAGRRARRVGSLGVWIAVAALGSAAGAGLGLIVERSSRAAAFGAGFGAAAGLVFRSAWRGRVIPPRRMRRPR
jgi:hypothetical protein